MKITVLGAGAWGTALAISLAQRNEVILWGRNQDALAAMQLDRINTHYLPGRPFPANLQASANFDLAMQHALDDGLLILASSVAGLRPLLQRCTNFPLKNVIWLCKGFEENSRLLPHQVVKQVLAEKNFGIEVAIGALSGPSFAQEVADGLPCALTIASTSPALCQSVIDAVHGPSMRVYSSDDVVGVEVGGAVKNILARPEQVKKVTETARKMVIEKYDWNMIARNMRERVFARLF